MAYSKVFNPEKYEAITKVIEALQRLTPGSGLSVSNSSPEAQERTRYLVYDWLHHMGLSRKFRLKMVGEVLMIHRLGFRTQPEVVQFGVSMDQAKIETLIELWGTQEAEATLASWVESKELSAQEGEELWEHLKRIMS